jgi:hypothetical protein
MSCLFSEVKGNQKRNGYCIVTKIPQAELVPKAVVDS